jgi:hypothetical protein
MALTFFGERLCFTRLQPTIANVLGSRWKLEPFQRQRIGSDVNLRVLTSGRLKRSFPGILAWPTCSAYYSVVEPLNLAQVPSWLVSATA